MRAWILLCFLPCGAFGGILYDNLGATNAYRVTSLVPSYTPGGYSETASHFYVSQGGTLTGFEGILHLRCCGSGPGQNRQFTLTVYEGSSGVGAALDTTTVVRQLEHYYHPGLAPTSAPFLGGVWLAPGDYYIGIRAPGEDIGWAFSTYALMPPFANRSLTTGDWVYATNGSNLTSRILGDPVPEPAAWQMLGCAAAVFGAPALLRRRVWLR